MSAFGGKADMALCGNLLLRSLLGVKRTWPFALHMSANDPKRTFSSSTEYRGSVFHGAPTDGSGKQSILHGICELLRRATIVRAGFALQVASHRIDKDRHFGW
jgi:hypothetical protein